MTERGGATWMVAEVAVVPGIAGKPYRRHAAVPMRV
jgi:hypothetical protein